MINKRYELLANIENENADVVCMSEILPKNQNGDRKIQQVELQIPGYDCFHNIDKGQCHRGVAIWTKKSLNAQEVKPVNDSKESVWCEISLKDSDKLLVGCLYRSPSDPCSVETKQNNEKLNDLIIEMTRDRSHVLITGDFNFPDIDWVNELSPPEVQASNFMEAIRESFLSQHVKVPTHYRSDQNPNILDLIFTSEESMIDSIRHEAPLGKSHHQTLCFVFKCYSENSKKSDTRYCYAKGDYKKLKEIVGSSNLVEEIKHLDVSDAWDKLKKVVLNAVELCVPKVKSGPGKQKALWMNPEVMKKLKKKKQSYKQYLRTKEGQDYQYYTRARNQAKSACRAAVRKYEKNIAKNAKKTPKGIFAYAKSKTKTKTGIADLKSGHGKATTDTEKANVLNGFFTSVFTDENLTDIPKCEKHPVDRDLDSVIFSKETVSKRLANLNPNKSPGNDGFHPKVLKELSKELGEAVAIIFQKSHDTGKLPKDWKEAQVTPIFKKGDKSEPGNYRPVSLTSVLCKVMEGIIRDNVINHLKRNKLLSDCQHGFISGRSCTTNLLATLNDWTEILDTGSPIDAVYLDFSKAFDSVPHIRLLTKLESYGVTGNTLHWIKDFLVGRKQRVNIQGSVSEWAQVKSGVPQGSVLGPVLFVSFINDLPDAVNSLCSMYADDTKVYRKINNLQDRNMLQEDIDKLVDWADKWQLRFNAGKCNVLQLGKNNHNFEYDMRNHGTTTKSKLNTSKIEKDLGVYVDSELKFSQHVENQVNKANKILGLIRRSFEFLDAETMKLLFSALVRPHLEFSNTAWSPMLEKDKALIEGVLRRATKIIPGLKDLPYEQRLKAMKLPSMSYRRIRGDLIETYKYTHDLYNVSSNLFEFNKCDRTRGHNFKLVKPRCMTSLRQHFFSQRVIERWNNLPPMIAEAPSVNAFKNRLDRLMKDNIFSIGEPPTRFWSKDQ